MFVGIINNNNLQNSINGTNDLTNFTQWETELDSIKEEEEEEEQEK